MLKHVRNCVNSCTILLNLAASEHANSHSSLTAAENILLRIKCWKTNSNLIPDLSNFNAQHVSNINTSVISSLRLFYCITTLFVCSCFDVCWSFSVAGWVGIRITTLVVCSCFDMYWSFSVAGWVGIRITTLVVCSCFVVCWSFSVAGWGGISVAGWSWSFSLRYNRKVAGSWWWMY